MIPGNLLVSTSVYQNDPNIVAGSTQLPPGCTTKCVTAEHFQTMRTAQSGTVLRGASFTPGTCQIPGKIFCFPGSP